MKFSPCCSVAPEGEEPTGAKGRKNAEDYAIEDAVWDASATIKCDVLYSVGGAYGNPEALIAVNEMVASSDEDIAVVYNGDMHWFDGTAENFELIENLSKESIRLSGNVEIELSREIDSEVGCGCSYPSRISNAFVSRSNAIHERMKDAIRDNASLVKLIKGRPAIAIAEVAGHRVALTHGDEKLVAGYGCSFEDLQNAERQEELDAWFKRHQIDVLSTTHTCAPAAIKLESGVVINNGAAGIPSYRDCLYGLLTRVATTPNVNAVYRSEFNGLYIEALPIRYNQDKFLEWFDSYWSPESAAAVSYRERIVHGLDQEFSDALLGGFEVVESA